MDVLGTGSVGDACRNVLANGQLGPSVENENLRVIALVSSKGGSGKSTLAKLFACALTANDYRVLLIDADPQRSLIDWVRLGLSAEASSPLAAACAAETVEDIQRLIDLCYDQNLADFIIIDTAGRGDDRLEQIVAGADHIVTPVKISTDDLEQSARVLAWHTDLSARVEGDQPLPGIVFVPTDVHSDLGKESMAVLQQIRDSLPTTPGQVPHREAYQIMNSNGFLMPLIEARDRDDRQTVRLQAKHVYDGLMIATQVVGQVLNGDRHAA